MSALEELRDQLAGVADDVYPDQLAATVEQLDTVAADLAEALRGSVNTHAHTALAQVSQAREHTETCLHLSTQAAGDLRSYAERL